MRYRFSRLDYFFKLLEYLGCQYEKKQAQAKVKFYPSQITVADIAAMAFSTATNTHTHVYPE